MMRFIISDFPKYNKLSMTFSPDYNSARLMTLLGLYLLRFVRFSDKSLILILFSFPVSAQIFGFPSESQ